MSCPVAPGQTYRFYTHDRVLRLTFLVVGMLPRPDAADECRASAQVLVLDRVTREAEDFRADVGQTTDWHFDSRQGEWKLLERVS